MMLGMPLRSVVTVKKSNRLRSAHEAPPPVWMHPLWKSWMAITGLEIFGAAELALVTVP
jgi:hypothetical protein